MRFHDPITGERMFVERHVRALAGISTAMVCMKGPGGTVSNYVVEALAKVLAFHAEQLCDALGIEVEVDSECASSSPG